MATDSEYEVVFTWVHDYAVAPSVGKSLDKNAKRVGGACDPEAGYTAPDGKPYWLPRFFPTPVPAEITRYTGIKFVSPDWQPCGHKDIVICHGESHYDFHLYYFDEATIKAEAGCDATPGKPGHYIICDDNTARNHKMFQLMSADMPISRTSSARSPMPSPHSAPGAKKTLQYCVDPTSGVPESGIHYGDKSETLTEWKEPVSIMGSHDCRLTFFEPMISWKWITNEVWGGKGWPSWHSGEIAYNTKAFKALPTSWKVDVSPGCQGGDSSKECRITVTVRGEKCPVGGCSPPARNCGSQPDCLTGQPYQSPFTLLPQVLPQAQVNTTNESDGSRPADCGGNLGGASHCFTTDGRTILTGTGNAPASSNTTTGRARASGPVSACRPLSMMALTSFVLSVFLERV